MPNPVKVTLVIGKQYAWCTCGMEGLCDEPKECNMDADFNEEFEDEANDVGDLNEQARPMTFTADRTEAFICTCKLTKTAPYCDGSHKTVKDEVVT